MQFQRVSVSFESSLDTFFKFCFPFSSIAANDELFLSKYTESGGNPKAFVWQGILGTLEGAPPVMDETATWPQIWEGRIQQAATFSAR